MNRSSLYQVHKAAGATFGEYYNWEMPARFSSVEAEYRAAKERAALTDRSYIGRIRMTGEDALDLLNRLSTNELMQLSPGSGLSTVLTSSKGRVVDLLTLYSRDDHLLLLTGPQNRQKVTSWIDQYTFSEEVALEDVTDSVAMLSVHGPQSSAVLRSLVGGHIDGLDPYQGVTTTLEGAGLYIARENPLWGEAYNIIFSATEAATIWSVLLEKGADQGLKPMGTEAYEGLRIEAGVPAYGSELGEEVNPLEAGLKSSISFTKGCYVGQEVVARLDTYDKVKRYLVKLCFEGGPLPHSSASLELEGKEVGLLTSVASLPGDGQAVALGYVRKPHARLGVKLTAGSGNGQSVGEIVALPGD